MIGEDNFATDKITDVKDYLTRNKLHALAICEADLSARKWSKRELESILYIPYYKLILPSSWKHHHQARIIAFVREDIFYEVIEVKIDVKEISMINVNIQTGNERKLAISFVYREFKNSITKIGSMKSQKNNLSKMIKTWNEIQTKHRDLLILGDINLCATKWEDKDYERSEMCDMMKRMMTETGILQLMNHVTRIGSNYKNERV